MKKFLILLGVFLGLQNLVLAQSGTIRGAVYDDETGEELLGATVLIAGTQNGSAADLDGSYSIERLEPGTYELLASYVSYETKRITGVVVKNGEVTIINIRLGSGDLHLEEIVIQADVIKNSESALLTLQKKSAGIMDGVSADQFKRGGDNNAADAIGRVTGVSVEGGKYVYVRGLGDRYSKTSLNGADMPGLDPNRNTVQMDLFPSNLLDNIVVHKTFSPDLPGDFTGGYVDIATKDFPEAFTFQFTTSFTYNSQANFNDDFIQYEGGSTDWLGIDDGDRSIPDLIKSTTNQESGDRISAIPFFSEASGDPEKADLLTSQTLSFPRKQMEPVSDKKFLGHSHAISVGNQVPLFGRPFGFVAGLTYRRDFDSYTGGMTGRYSLAGSTSTSLTTQLGLADAKSTESILWGGLLNLSYKITDNNRISFNYIRNQSADIEARSQFGKKPEDDPDLNFVTEALWFTERSLTSYQLKGLHNLPGSNIQLDWLGAFTKSVMQEPDLRFFTYGYFADEDDTDTTFRIFPSIGQIPTRYYRDMEETSFDGKINLTIPFKQWNGLSGKFKVGGAYLIKDREFREEQYRYESQPNPPSFFDGNPDNYISQDVWSIDKTEGSYLTDAFDDGNSYDADQEVIGAYAMVELPITSKFRTIAGARFETTDINTVSFDPDDAPGRLDDQDVLPSVALVYELIENMNLRAAYSKTLARPSFRELAPFASFDFIGDFLLVGNPNLERTRIDNLDLRWEYFSRAGELFAVSFFYKDFDKPIERTFNIVAAQEELTFRNVERGQAMGIETEIRKRLDFIDPRLFVFTIGANVTLVDSKVDIDPEEFQNIIATNPEADDQRPMFGQSDYIINAFLTYQNEMGTRANITYNVAGERIAVVTDGGAPNVYEQPRPVLNFNISQQVNRWSFRLSANNLLNPDIKLSQEFEGQEFIFQNSQLGRDFSIGVTYTIQ